MHQTVLFIQQFHFSILNWKFSGSLIINKLFSSELNCPNRLLRWSYCDYGLILWGRVLELPDLNVVFKKNKSCLFLLKTGKVKIWFYLWSDLTNCVLLNANTFLASFSILQYLNIYTDVANLKQTWPNGRGKSKETGSSRPCSNFELQSII